MLDKFKLEFGSSGSDLRDAIDRWVFSRGGFSAVGDPVRNFISFYCFDKFNSIVCVGDVDEIIDFYGLGSYAPRVSILVDLLAVAVAWRDLVKGFGPVDFDRVLGVVGDIDDVDDVHLLGFDDVKSRLGVVDGVV